MSSLCACVGCSECYRNRAPGLADDCLPGRMLRCLRYQTPVGYSVVNRRREYLFEVCDYLCAARTSRYAHTRTIDQAPGVRRCARCEVERSAKGVQMCACYSSLGVLSCVRGRSPTCVPPLIEFGHLVRNEPSALPADSDSLRVESLPALHAPVKRDRHEQTNQRPLPVGG